MIDKFTNGLREIIFGDTFDGNTQDKEKEGGSKVGANEIEEIEEIEVEEVEEVEEKEIEEVEETGEPSV
jgi:CRISPR/Cas system-associated protein Cas7 (RAMP superfamily)